MRVLLISLKRSIPSAPKPNIVEACKSWVEAVETCGVEEAKEAWDKIRRLQNKLVKVATPSPLQKALLRIMDPVVKKFGDLDPKGISYMKEGD